MNLKWLLKENYLKSFKANWNGIKTHCKDFNVDWVFVNGGIEGYGKSTWGIIKAFFLDPKFNFKKQNCNNLSQYVKITRKFRKEPFKVIIFDEAVRAFFSREFAYKSNVILVKLFISNRSFRHYHILNIPSVFYLDRYLREWRIKNFDYIYIEEKQDPNSRMAAFYSKINYIKILKNEARSRFYMILPELFLRYYEPDFVEKFNKLPENIWEEMYEPEKEKIQDELLEEAYQEALKLEERKKLGFHEKMKPEDFFRWLGSRFREGFKLRFTVEKVARTAVTRTETINYLIGLCNDLGYMNKTAGNEWILTQKGLEILGLDKYASIGL